MKQTEYLKCVLSDAEMTDLSQELAREIQALDRFQDQRKEVVACLEAQIETASAACRRLSALVTNGYEYRNVECEVYLNDPEPGQKTLYRTDTGEAVKTEKMTDAEKQQDLPFKEVM